MFQRKIGMTPDRWKKIEEIFNQAVDYVKAEIIFRKVLEMRQQNMAADHLDIVKAKGLLGECLKEEKRYAEAEPLMLDSYRAYKAKLGANHPNSIETAERLKSLYVARGKPAEVTRLQ